MKDLEKLVRPNIAALCPYSTARDEYQGSLGIFLDANESAYENGWNRYPDPHQKLLKEKISAVKGVGAQNIFLGNGIDEAIDLVFRVFCNPGADNVVAISPSYGMYEVAAAINDIELRKVSLGSDFQLDLDALFNAVDSRTKAIFLCSPNNPSGNAYGNDVILSVAQRFGGIVVLDEAYIDFCSIPSLISKVNEVNNLIVLQTFSKARGMAALRLGMAFASPEIIRLMSMVKYPYNINKATQELAMEMLDKSIEGQVAETIAERQRLAEALKDFPFVKMVYPSQANFLLVKVDDADKCYDYLLENGVIVRNRTRVPGCGNCLRISVGTPQENGRLLDLMRKY